MGWPNYAEVGNGDCLTVTRALPCPVCCVGGQGRRVLPPSPFHRPMLAQRNASAPAKKAEEHLSLIRTNSDVAAPSLRGHHCCRQRSKAFEPCEDD